MRWIVKLAILMSVWVPSAFAEGRRPDPYAAIVRKEAASLRRLTGNQIKALRLTLSAVRDDHSCRTGPSADKEIKLAEKGLEFSLQVHAMAQAAAAGLEKSANPHTVDLVPIISNLLDTIDSEDEAEISLVRSGCSVFTRGEISFGAGVEGLVLMSIEGNVEQMIGAKSLRVLAREAPAATGKE